MHDHNPKYRPSLIEENPALLIWLLLLGAYLLALADRQVRLVHPRRADRRMRRYGCCWLALPRSSAIYQLTRAKIRS